MTHDDIVNEVRQARAALLAEHGGDIHALLRAMRERQGQSGHPLVTAPPGGEIHYDRTKNKAAESRAKYGK